MILGDWDWIFFGKGRGFAFAVEQLNLWFILTSNELSPLSLVKMDLNFNCLSGGYKRNNSFPPLKLQLNHQTPILPV